MPDEGVPGGGRQRVLGRRSVWLVVAGGVLTALAMLSLWSWRTFASSQGFADTATDMLKEPAVREIVADQVVEALQEQAVTAQFAAAASPAMEQIVEQVVATPAFQGILHAGVRNLHSAMVEGVRSRMLVDVDDSAQLVKESLRVLNPDLADSIPNAAINVAVGLSRGTPVDTLVLSASIAGWLAMPLAAGAAVCFVFSVRGATDRRRAIEAIGFCLVVIGVGFFAILAVGVSLAAHFGGDPRERTALRAVFWSATHLINVQAKVAITIGAVLIVSASYVGKGRPVGRFRDVWTSATASLARPQGKVAVSLLGITCAVFAMAFPAATAAIAVRVGAFVAFVAGTVGLLDVVGEREWALGSSPRVREASTRLVAWSAAGIAACSVVLLFGGVAFARAVRAPSNDPLSISEAGCNGHRELCDRRVDEVAFAGTHNSMSATSAEGWYAGRHFDDIPAQLGLGIRAFLIDLHYGYRSQGVVRTDFRSEFEEAAAKEQLSPTGQDALAAVSVRVGAGTDDDRAEVYLCHGFCELGATKASDMFRNIDSWLRENPNEVLIFVVEDHVDAADAVGAFERGGLLDRTYSWTPGDPLPTLRTMIETGRNILVFAENDGGLTPSYIPAYGGAIMETHYEFAKIADFSCEANRGGSGRPLFLLNHWVATDAPNSALAGQANAMEVLGERARQCAEERGHVPNIIAVDFSTEGDLMAVVAELNELVPATEP